MGFALLSYAGGAGNGWAFANLTATWPQLHFGADWDDVSMSVEIGLVIFVLIKGGEYVWSGGDWAYVWTGVGRKEQ